MARNYGIYLNQKKVGTIGNGQTKEFEIDSGIYEINAKIDWCRSQTLEFEVTNNENKTFEIGGFKYGNYIMPMGLGLILIYFLLTYILEIEFKFLISIALIGPLFLLYYITFGKNRYLRLIEID